MNKNQRGVVENENNEECGWGIQTNATAEVRNFGEAYVTGIQSLAVRGACAYSELPSAASRFLKMQGCQRNIVLFVKWDAFAQRESQTARIKSSLMRNIFTSSREGYN